MAGPLSGISGQGAALQQAQNVQQQQNQNTGLVGENDEAEQQNNEVQPQGAPAAETQSSENTNQNVFQQQIEDLIASGAIDNDGNSELQRGSLLDIEV